MERRQFVKICAASAAVGSATPGLFAQQDKGQGLSPLAPARITEARGLIAQAGRTGQILLAADGGIRTHTVPVLRAAGADTVVMGSLAFGSDNLPETLRWLHALPIQAA